MKISQVINELAKQLQKHGDLEVHYFEDYDIGYHMPVSEVLLHADNENHKFIVIE